jgi:hypothetical protein
MTFTGTGRADLLALVEKLEARITELQELGSKLVESRQNMRENIARHLLKLGHTALALDVRNMVFDVPTDSEAKLALPGWICEACGVFNGEAKRKYAECRSCSRPRSC